MKEGPVVMKGLKFSNLAKFENVSALRPSFIKYKNRHVQNFN